MAQIRVPMISPFTATGPLHDADDRHIQSHHVAYEIASLNHSLNRLIAQYDALIENVTSIQAKHLYSPTKNGSLALKKAEKTVLSSMLPHQIKTIRAKIKNLNTDLQFLTR
jgi:hypothetical protein